MTLDDRTDRVDWGSARRVLLVRLRSLGDIVCALPALRALRRAAPRARVGVVVEPRFRGAVEADPLFDEVLAGEGVALLRRVRAWRPDVSVDLHGGPRAAWLVRLSGARTRVGLARVRLAGLYGIRVATDPAARHAVDGWIDFAGRLGATADPADRRVALTGADREGAARVLGDAGLADGGVLVACSPGVGYPAKRWAAARWGEVLGRLCPAGGARAAVVLWAPHEAALAREVAAAAGDARVAAAPSGEIRPNAALMERAAVHLSSDTGAMHVAAGLGVPCVALFGPADPEVHGPYGEGHLVLRKKCLCPGETRCRFDEHPCMSAIGADEVVAATEAVLSAHRLSSRR